MGKVLGKAIKNYTRKQSTTKNNIVTPKKQKTRIGEDVLPLKKIMNLPDNLGFIDLFFWRGRIHHRLCKRRMEAAIVCR